MVQPNALAKRLAGGPMLCDGGMGTLLMEAGLEPGLCGMLWNIDKPQVIEGIASRYARAGCHMLTTNSFEGTRVALERHGLGRRVEELNRAAAQLARRAAEGRCFVLGDVGPFGGFLEPLGPTTPDELEQIFCQQIQALQDGGVDGIIIETMSDPAELACAMRAARKVGSWPVLATYAFQKAGPRYATMMGVGVEQAVAQALEAGADVVGANCGTNLSLDDYARLAEQVLAAAGDRPVIVQPNAGSPQLVGGRQVYPATPQEMADLAEKLLDMGVRVIGGCCGTTPDHLAAISRHFEVNPSGP